MDSRGRVAGVPAHWQQCFHGGLECEDLVILRVILPIASTCLRGINSPERTCLPRTTDPKEPNRLFGWATVSNRGHKSTRRPPPREKKHRKWERRGGGEGGEKRNFGRSREGRSGRGRCRGGSGRRGRRAMHPPQCETSTHTHRETDTRTNQDHPKNAPQAHTDTSGVGQFTKGKKIIISRKKDRHHIQWSEPDTQDIPDTPATDQCRLLTKKTGPRRTWPKQQWPENDWLK